MEVERVTVPATAAWRLKRGSISRRCGAPDGGDVFAPVLVRSDMAAVARSASRWSVLHGGFFRTAPSAVAVAMDREIPHADMVLIGQSGAYARHFHALDRRDLVVRVVVSEHGNQIGAATRQTAIDGDSGSRVWRTSAGKMPEEYYHGTWKNRRAVASNRHRIIGLNTIEINVEWTSSDTAFVYRNTFPFYAELLSA